MTARGSLAALALAAGCFSCATPVQAAPQVAPGVHASPSSPVRSAALEAAVLQELNRTRARAGLPRLRPSPPLARAALFHSREMASGGYFDHASVGGLPFWSRIARFYPRARFGYWAVGENLLWATDPDAAEVVESWLESPKHRANILSRTWREVGLGAVTAPGAEGTFSGLDVTILTADFGTRR